MGDQLFYSVLSAEDLSAMYYDLLCRVRGGDWTENWDLADQAQFKGRAALCRAIEDLQAELI
jgi:hypothetical protein